MNRIAFAITKVTIPDPSEMTGGIGNALAWDATEGVFWTVTDQQPAMTEPWLLHLYRVRTTRATVSTGG